MREANARVDKLGEILSHEVLCSDFLRDVLPGLVLQALKCNLSGCLVFESDIVSRGTLTFSANTNADLGEQKPIR